jgi:signal transduction histidine kinase
VKHSGQGTNAIGDVLMWGPGPRPGIDVTPRSERVRPSDGEWINVSDSRHLSGWSNVASLVGALVAVAAPVVAVALLTPDTPQVTEVAGVSGVVTYVVVLFADLLIYLHWRMTGGPAGWLVLVLTALAIQSLALAGFVAADPVTSQTHPTRVLFVQIGLAICVLALVPRAARITLRVDPIAAGAAVGVAVIVLRYLLVANTRPIHLSMGSLHALTALVLAIDLVIALAVFRLTVGPTWVRAQLAVAMAFLSVGHAAAYPVPDGVFLSVVTVVTNVLGGSVLLTLSIRLVRMSWLDNKAALELLGRQLEQAEAGARVERARMHELRATIAGLGTASRLVHHGSAVPNFRRTQIEEMIDAELERLQRLLNEDSGSGSPKPVDLDATIRPIVLRHRTRGYPIHWEPSGHWALARADDVAEVINVLLENAFQHAPGAAASIQMRRAGRVVEIAVSDTGPGISRTLRPRIFEWGGRDEASAGSGIGLNVAQQLSTDLGGYLRLVESRATGSTFVLGLPAKDPS